MNVLGRFLGKNSHASKPYVGSIAKYFNRMPFRAKLGVIGIGISSSLSMLLGGSNVTSINRPATTKSTI